MTHSPIFMKPLLDIFIKKFFGRSYNIFAITFEKNVIFIHGKFVFNLFKHLQIFIYILKTKKNKLNNVFGVNTP
jgi:hypothetical protein